jgi:hypothetical protein
MAIPKALKSIEEKRLKEAPDAGGALPDPEPDPLAPGVDDKAYGDVGESLSEGFASPPGGGQESAGGSGYDAGQLDAKTKQIIQATAQAKGTSYGDTISALRAMGVKFGGDTSVLYSALKDINNMDTDAVLKKAQSLADYTGFQPGSEEGPADQREMLKQEFEFLRGKDRLSEQEMGRMRDIGAELQAMTSQTKADDAMAQKLAAHEELTQIQRQQAEARQDIVDEMAARREALDAELGALTERLEGARLFGGETAGSQFAHFGAVLAGALGQALVGGPNMALETIKGFRQSIIDQIKTKSEVGKRMMDSLAAEAGQQDVADQKLMLAVNGRLMREMDLAMQKYAGEDIQNQLQQAKLAVASDTENRLRSMEEHAFKKAMDKARAKSQVGAHIAAETRAENMFKAKTALGMMKNAAKASPKMWGANVVDPEIASGLDKKEVMNLRDVSIKSNDFMTKMNRLIQLHDKYSREGFPTEVKKEMTSLSNDLILLEKEIRKLGANFTESEQLMVEALGIPKNPAGVFNINMGARLRAAYKSAGSRLENHFKHHGYAPDVTKWTDSISTYQSPFRLQQ